MKNQETTVVLHTYTDAMKAKIIQDKLKLHGVKSFLNDENVLGMDPVGGVELRVFEADREKAERIINET